MDWNSGVVLSAWEYQGSKFVHSVLVYVLLGQRVFPPNEKVQ